MRSMSARARVRAISTTRESSAMDSEEEDGIGYAPSLHAGRVCSGRPEFIFSQFP